MVWVENITVQISDSLNDDSSLVSMFGVFSVGLKCAYKMFDNLPKLD